MPKPSIVVAFAVALLAMFALAGWLSGYANLIDNAHWTGTPLPPCFVDAAKCGGHWLGTDEVGRDLLARLIVAAPFSLGISLGGAALEFGLLTCLLLLLQRGAGRARVLVEWIVEGVSGFCAWPLVLVIAVLTFSLDARPLVRLAMLALTAGALLTARSTPELSKRGNPRSFMGARVIRDCAAIMLMLATIDFFGLGVQPPVPSWGNMLVNFQANFQIAWWVAVFPALCLFVAALLLEIGARTFF